MNDTQATGGSTPGGDAARRTGQIDAGSVIGPFRIRAELGRGGMGVVYRADHSSLGRECALKVIAPFLAADSRFRDRFKREARAAASVDHPNVIPVYDAGSGGDDGEILYIAMKLVEGVEAGTLASPGSPLDPVDAAQIIEQAAAGLDAAHQAGLVHRDVKPANLLVEGSRATGDFHVYVTDFGISRISEGGGATTAGELLGSADYIAPEQIEGEDIDGRADIYALGGILHFLLTGHPPYADEGSSQMAKLIAHREASPPVPSSLVPGIPPLVDTVVATAMAKRPEDRFATAGEMALTLRAAVDPESAPTASMVRPPADAAQRVRVGRREHPGDAASGRWRKWLLGAAGLLVVLVLAGLALVALGVLGDGDEDGENAGAVSSIELPFRPSGVATGPSAVWVSTAEGRAIYRFNLGENDGADFALGEFETFDLDGAAGSVEVGLGWAWTTLARRNQVVRLMTNGRSETIDVGERPRDIALDRNFAWVADTDGGTVSKIDPANPDEVETAVVGGSPVALTVGDNRVWVAGAGGSVAQIDARTLERVGRDISLGGRPADMVIASGRVWVTDERRNVVVPISIAEATPGEPIEVGAAPRGMVVAGGWLWVANSGDGTLSRIDPVEREVAGEPLEVGGSPIAIAVSNRALWVVDGEAQALRRVLPQ